MEIDLQNLLSRIIVAFPFGIGAIVFCAIAVRRLGRFFIMDYQGNSKERFKDNLVANICMGVGVGCLLSAFFAFQAGQLSLSLIPLALCFGGLIIPIGIVGAYWRSYQMNKLWGGFMPFVREQYGYPQSPQTPQHKIDLSKIKIPRRTMFTQFLIALLAFFGMYALLDMFDWNGSVLAGLLFRLFVSALLAFGIFMGIGSASLSRRIQKMRDGEPLDDDKDS